AQYTQIVWPINPLSLTLRAGQCPEVLAFRAAYGGARVRTLPTGGIRHNTAALIRSSASTRSRYEVHLVQSNAVAISAGRLSRAEPLGVGRHSEHALRPAQGALRLP